MVRKLNRKAAEAYSQSFSDKLLDNFFADREIASGQDLLELTPVQQLNLLLVQRLYLRWQDETLRMRSPYFNYEHPQVQEALKAFMNTLSRHIALERPALESLLQEAVLDSLRLLLNPMAFFADLIAAYPNPDSLQASLRYLRWQQPLTDVLNEQIELKEVRENEYLLAILEAGIRSGKLELEPLDDHLQAYEQVLPLPYDLVDESSEAVLPPPTATEEEPTDFFSAIARQAPRPSKPTPKPAPQETVPAAVEQRIPEASPAEKPMEKASPAAPQPVAPQPVAPQPIASQQTTSQAATPPADTTAAKDVRQSGPEVIRPTVVMPAAPVPQETHAATKSTGSASNKQEDARTLNGRFDKGEKKPLYEKFESKEAKVPLHQKQQRSGSIRNYITLNQRFMFIKELFGGDAAAFNAALDSLDASQNLQEAHLWLQEQQTSKPGWKEDSPALQEFQNLLVLRFGS